MTSIFYIDGDNARTKYSISIAENGYLGLVNYPSLKKFEINDWADENGLDPDLSNPLLKSREISINFLSTDIAKTEEFFYKLTDKAYHTFRFEDLDLTLRMRLENQSSLNGLRELQVFTLKFKADDSPLLNYKHEQPTNTKESGCSLDDLDFSAYELQILYGTEKEIRKLPAVKKNCTIESENISGVFYDDSLVLFSAKDVRMSLLMRVATIAEFWKNWKAFLHNLTQPEGRIIGYNGEEYPAYYKSCLTKEFYINRAGNVWWKFDLVMCFYDFRLSTVNESLLATEMGILLTTEDDYFIDLN